MSELNLEETMREANERFAEREWKTGEPKKPEELLKINTENWIEVKSGMVYETIDEKPEWQRTIGQMPDDRKGFYSETNRIITFVDGEGRQFVAPKTEELVEELKSAGYIEGAVNVPFASGQTPADPTLKMRWEKMFADRAEAEKKEADNLE